MDAALRLIIGLVITALGGLFAVLAIHLEGWWYWLLLPAVLAAAGGWRIVEVAFFEVEKK